MTDKTQTKAVSNAPLTDEEFAEKYNRGHKIIDFVGHKKIFFGISLAIIIIGIVCNFIFGTQLDIQFSGGATAQLYLLHFSLRGITQFHHSILFCERAHTCELSQ